MHIDALFNQVHIVLSSILTAICLYYTFPAERRRWPRVLFLLSAGIAALLQPFFMLALLLLLLAAFLSVFAIEKPSIQSKPVGFLAIAIMFVMSVVMTEISENGALWMIVFQAAIACWYFIPDLHLQKLRSLTIKKLRPALIVAGFQVAIVLNVQATTVICSCGGGGDEAGERFQDCGCGAYNWMDDFFTLQHAKSVWSELGNAGQLQ